MPSFGFAPSVGRPVGRALVALLIPTITSVGVAYEIHIHPSASMRALGSLRSREGQASEDAAAFFDVSADDPTAQASTRVRIMRNQVSAKAFQHDRDTPVAEVQMVPTPSSDTSLHEASSRPASAPVDGAVQAPASSPANVELTFSWRESVEDLPKLLAEVARVKSSQHATVGPQIMSLVKNRSPQDRTVSSFNGPTPAPASDQDAPAPPATPAPMPSPDTSDDSMKGFPLFVFFVCMLCCICGGIGTCIYFAIHRRTVPRDIAGEPLVSQTAKPERETRSYKERRKKTVAIPDDDVDKDTKDEEDDTVVTSAEPGETGGSRTTVASKSETGGSRSTVATNAANATGTAKTDNGGEEETHL